MKTYFQYGISTYHEMRTKQTHRNKTRIIYHISFIHLIVVSNPYFIHIVFVICVFCIRVVIYVN